jgi:hypothetical protein
LKLNAIKRDFFSTPCLHEINVTARNPTKLIMKSIALTAAILSVLLSACSTTTNHTNKSGAKSEPETVLVTYHVKHGKEAEIRALQEQVWKLYLKHNLVFTKGHVVVTDKEEGGKPRIVEILTWVNSDAPDNVTPDIGEIWKQESSLCEPRAGQSGIDIDVVQLRVP